MKSLPQYFPFVWFYIGWFGCVFLGKYGHSEWSPLFPLILVALLIIWRKLNLKTAGILLLLGSLGIFFDSMMASKNWMVFANPDFVFLPLWLISIWLLFVFVLPTMVPVFFTRLWLAAILGAVFGPLSYVSGKALEVLSLQGATAIGLCAAFWALYFPLSIYVVGAAERLKHSSSSR